MSQEKVDYYKEQKKNRKKIMKQEKIRTRLEITAIVVAVVALVSWFSVSVYKNVKATKEANRETVTTQWDVSDYDKYQTQLQAYISDSDEDADSTSASSDVSSSSDAEESESVVSAS
ncbi:MAG: hypothetical protein U0L49_09935 [Eubacterium sp.]|nr:hypothetical protein [Eubacterium sp.]